MHFQISCPSSFCGDAAAFGPRPVKRPYLLQRLQFLAWPSQVTTATVSSSHSVQHHHTSSSTSSYSLYAPRAHTMKIWGPCSGPRLLLNMNLSFVRAYNKIQVAEETLRHSRNIEPNSTDNKSYKEGKHCKML
jgi:hypothetical protein